MSLNGRPLLSQPYQVSMSTTEKAKQQAKATRAEAIRQQLRDNRLIRDRAALADGNGERLLAEYRAHLFNNSQPADAEIEQPQANVVDIRRTA